MQKVALVYDDTITPKDRIKTIIGDKSFGNIVLKRKKLFTRIEDEINKLKLDIDFIKIDKLNDFKFIKSYSNNTIFFHIMSNYAITDNEKFDVLLEKLQFIKQTMTLKNNTNIGVIFSNKGDYLNFLKEYTSVGNIEFEKENVTEINYFMDLAEYDNLLIYISGGFDSRFFNSLEGDKYIVTKKSKDKLKMEKEYKYYWLLPEEMKSWMVMPYNFKDHGDYASYTMERMPMTDIAIRWTHEAIDEKEFRHIMDKIFYFFSIRPQRDISKDEFEKMQDEIYIKKVENRVENLKKLEQYKNLKLLIQSGTEYNSIDDIIEEYKKLYYYAKKKYIKDKRYKFVIGHGDVFFANMLYSKEINLLRLIDPKGCLKEEELWTDQYYDIAKLSHSICGNYDFFNVDAFSIELDKNMKFNLNINFDNKKYVEIFKEYLNKYGFEYNLIRIYEASLFLSMLPLHIDNPHKVFGFILNAINIIKEIEANV